MRANALMASAIASQARALSPVRLSAEARRLVTSEGAALGGVVALSKPVAPVGSVRAKGATEWAPSKTGGTPGEGATAGWAQGAALVESQLASQHWRVRQDSRGWGCHL